MIMITWTVRKDGKKDIEVKKKAFETMKGVHLFIQSLGGHHLVGKPLIEEV